jgi:phosphotriesterase-related protein
MEKEDYSGLKIILWLILFLFFGIIIICCKPVNSNYIMTVNGPINPMKMGVTLQHEHILVDFSGADSIEFSKWDRNEVVAKMLPVLIDAKNEGLNTFIDCTPEYLGRDPLLLRELSQKTGINIITNTGYYGAYNNFYIPKSFYETTAESLAAQWIKEFDSGIDNTGIKPGFIKIAVNPDDTLSPEHRKIITAAGLTHLVTGMVIASHTGPDKPAFEQITILKEMGIAPSAFIWVHAQKGTIEGNMRAAMEGVWISFDKVSINDKIAPGETNSIEWYVEKIIKMKENGLIHRVLISHDSGWYEPGKPGGGKINGYTDIFTSLIPELKSKGMTDKEIEQILVINPREAFTIRSR